MKPQELIKAAMEKRGIKSQRELARLLEVDHTMVTRWCNGERALQFEEAATLADMAGLPPIATAAALRLSAVDAKEQHALLKRLSKSAAALLIALAWMHNANCEQINIVDNAQFYITQTDYTFTLVQGVASTTDSVGGSLTLSLAR